MTVLNIYCGVILFILGAVFGSFLNCMAWRIVHHESILKGRSHCANCNHPLKAGDLIPIISWVFLKGKCRYCGQKISFRYPAAELVCAGSFLLSFIRFGFSFQTVQVIVLACILLALSLADFESYEIPDRFILAGIIWWVITSCVLGGWIKGIIGGLAIGGGMLVISLVFDKVLGKESLGGGDIKLFFMTGLYMGVLTGLFSLILSCIIGLLFAVGFRKSRIPFGPAISLASFISILYGSYFVSWYLSLLA